MNITTRTWLFSLAALVSLIGRADRSAAADATTAAAVITRTFGPGAMDHVHFESLPTTGDRDVFEYAATAGELTVRGTSPVALDSGYYQFVRRHGLGVASWSGDRLDRSHPWPDAPLTRVESPYALRYYLNVVTFGYTMPYWTWDRWEREVDWMALHGINMPLSLVGTEAIATRVWRQVGLTRPEIDAFYTGPAHLPWQRMGNLANVDGPLSDAWHADQVALEHKILDRERSLGMHPIAQGFSGFVPQALHRIYPDAKLTTMKWSGFKREVEHNHLLSPESPCFIDLGRRTVAEWEREFGKGEYFLADSFNEMELPVQKPAERNALFERYGDILYRSVTAADPSATWVMQGWMFSYQPDIWTHDALRSLLAKVPDEKMVILDEALDYSAPRIGGPNDWTNYDGFFGKRWVAGYIPNMGGKTLPTGPMDFYAAAAADALASPRRGRLAGLGIVPEGIENNEVLYELIADTAWTDRPIDVAAWLKDYARARYGPETPAAVDRAFALLHEGPYRRLIPHPHFTWQLTPGRGRQAGDDPNLMPAADAFLSAAPALHDNPLYAADAVELSALAAGGTAERLINQAIDIGDFDPAARRALADRALAILERTDQALAAHPTLRLDRWVDDARSHGTTDAERDHYEANAKLLVTLWGHNGEISDYSARVWSGLIGGYYVPRWRMYFDALDGRPADIRGFERSWVATPLRATTRPAPDPVTAAQDLLAACRAPLPPMPTIERTPIAAWSAADGSTTWKTIDWPVRGERLNRRSLVEFAYTTGGCRLDVRSVELLDGAGRSLARDAHVGRTGTANVANRYVLAMPADPDNAATYTLRVVIRTDGGTDSNGVVNVLRRAGL
jgi:alpha-N-acetylglucosaminidase